MATQENYGPTSYGDELADIYDNWIVRLQDDTDDTVRVLGELADSAARASGAKRILELGVGTGRVALPLSERGLEITGIDASPDMLDRLREKPGSHRVTLVQGDFADHTAEGPFALVYIVFNTLYSLSSQEEQLNCLSNAARLLPDDGLFVVQGFVPDTARFEMARQSQQLMEVARSEESSLNLGVARHDPVTQRMWPHYSLRDSANSRDHIVQFRYVWPSELDLMARLAGLTLEQRYGGWDRSPFTGESQQHVSVYRKTGAARP
ncbi:class I SAM-dependent DNA methyltransferase [Streptomyces sp. NPDC087219]|uniref:class I SAM-dependent DNA methyltransferase n=1 Tax=unclassified Streptomyces TaxID=2593676 RepID=UPI00380944FB